LSESASVLTTALSARNLAAQTTNNGDPMALHGLDVARTQRRCGARIPEHARHQLRIECQLAARQLTIFERRAPWREDLEASASRLKAGAN
jgi:hypothetical protein